MSDSILQRRGVEAVPCCLGKSPTSTMRLSVFIWQLECSWITWNELYNTYIYRYLCNDNYFHYHYHCHCVNVWYIFIFSTSLFSYLHVHSKHRPPRWLCLGFPTVKTSHKKYAMIDIRSLKLAVRPRKYAFPKGHWSSNPILLRDCFREGNFGTNKCRSLFFVGGSTKTRP